MPTELAILRLKRVNREWHVDAEVPDLPGGTTPINVIRPIIIKRPNQPNLVTWATKGHISPDEQFAYVMWKHIARNISEREVSTTDNCVVIKIKS